jgi:hypothetical protein
LDAVDVHLGEEADVEVLEPRVGLGYGYEETVARADVDEVPAGAAQRPAAMLASARPWIRPAMRLARSSAVRGGPAHAEERSAVEDDRGWDVRDFRLWTRPLVRRARVPRHGRAGKADEVEHGGQRTGDARPGCFGGGMCFSFD